MKAIEVDIDKVNEPQDLLKAIKKTNPHGSENELYLKFTDGLEDSRRLIVLVFIEAAFNIIFHKADENKIDNFVSDSLSKIANHHWSIWEFENNVEQAWNLNIQWKPKITKTEDPLDGLFGLWKDKDVALDTIRNKAWPERP